MNEHKFVPTDNEHPVSHLSVFNTFQIQNSVSFSYPIKIRRQKLSLSDSIFSIGQLLADTYDTFTVEVESISPTTFIAKDGLSEVSIELDTDLYTYTRTAYSLLDFLRDIGGLFGAFNAIFTGIVWVLNFNGIYQWLSSNLFKVQSLKEHTD